MTLLPTSARRDRCGRWNRYVGEEGGGGGGGGG